MWVTSNAGRCVLALANTFGQDAHQFKPKTLGYLEASRREKNLPGGIRKAAVVAPYEFTLGAIAQNLRRLAKLVARPPPAAEPCPA